MLSSDGGVMEPAPMGAAKEGAAGSVIVAKRRDSRVQRRASSAAAAILTLVTCASVALLQLLALEAGAVCAAAMDEIRESGCV
jgi:hypothetical protein